MENNNIITQAFAQQGIKSQAEIDALNSKSTKHIQIGDELFRVKLIGGRRGVQIALKLKQIALPLLGRAFDGLKDEDDFIETPKTFTDMAVLLNHSLDDSNIDSLIFEDILFDVQIKHGDSYIQINWDEYLMANYSCLIPLLAFAIKENFGSFFTGSGMMKGILGKITNLLGSSQDEPLETQSPEQNS